MSGLENRYVRVTGLPDRESALQIDTKGSWVFSQLFRVLGTGDRLFLHRRESPLPAALAEADVFEGRLIRVDDLPFAASIRSYFSTPRGGHALLRARRARARAGRSASPGRRWRWSTPAAITVALDERETIAIDVTQPDEVRIGLPRDRFATEDDGARRARLARRAGGDALGADQGQAAACGARGGTAVVDARADAALDLRGEVPGDRRRRRRSTPSGTSIRTSRSATRARPSRSSWRMSPAPTRRPPGATAALVVRPGAGAAAPARRPPIAAIHTMAPVVIPDDAYLLVEGDRPREHAPTVLIALILVMFGAVNLVGLFRELLPVHSVDGAPDLRHPRREESPVRAARAGAGRDVLLRHHRLRPLPRRPRAHDGGVRRDRPPPARVGAMRSPSSATSPTSTTRSSARPRPRSARPPRWRATTPRR